MWDILETKLFKFLSASNTESDPEPQIKEAYRSFALSGTLLELFTNNEIVVQKAFYPFCVMLSTFIIPVPITVLQYV